MELNDEPAHNPPFGIPIAFAIASYAVSVTGTLAGCYFWLELVPLAEGTEVRPMGAVLGSLVFAGGGSVAGITLGIVSVVIGRRRMAVWMIGTVVILLALLPLPITYGFSEWMMEARGLIPKP